VTLDEENKEILINNFMTGQTTVYDLYGNFAEDFLKVKAYAMQPYEILTGIFNWQSNIYEF